MESINQSINPACGPSLSPTALRTCELCERPGLNPSSYARHHNSGACQTANVTGKYRRGPNQQPAAPTAAPNQPINATDDLPARLRELRQTRRLADRIPRHARKQAAEALSGILDECLADNSIASWSKLFMFAYNAFSLPPLGKNGNKTGNLTAIIKRNLLHGAPDTPVVDAPKRDKPGMKLRKAVERKLNRGDVSGAVRILASDDAVAAPTAEIRDILVEKHPADDPNADYPTPPTEHDPAPTAVTKEEVQRAITSFPHGSAGGVDGLRPQDLQDMVGPSVGDASTRLLESLANLLTILLEGRVTPAICPILYGASLTALRKKDAGGIRPIAVGHVLRRLAGKIVNQRVMTAMGALVRPAQLGYGTRGGCEAAVHGTRSFMLAEEETTVLLKMDFRNAFNTVHREVMLRSVRIHLPDYYRFVWQMYRYPSQLSFGDFVLQSQAGVQQGDPLAPLLFCLVTRDLTVSMVSPLNTWYLDDATVGGSVKDVEADLRLVMDRGREIGLELNLAKCEAFVYGGDEKSRLTAIARMSNVAPTIGLPTRASLRLLGSPLLPEGVANALEEKTETLRLLTSRLAELHAHQALYLLKNCLSAPKVMYILRSSPAWSRTDKLRELDDLIRRSLASITNTDVTDTAWRQATLPVSRGGLGIRRTEEISLPAFLASVYSVAGLISVIAPDAALDVITAAPRQHWCTLTNKPPPTTSMAIQRQWDTPIVEDVMEELINAASLRDRARLLATKTKESGYWLQALPSSSLGTLLDDDAVRISVGKRLGVDLVKQHDCKCKHATVYGNGHHGLSCLHSAGRHCRHSAINELIKRALNSAQIPAKLEPQGMMRDSAMRPDGKTMIPWKNGQFMCWDVTCVCTMADSYIGNSHRNVGYAVDQAETKKRHTYRHLGDNVVFFPVGFETFGVWGESAKEMVAEIGRRIAEHTGERRAAEFLRQRISIEIERGNAISILNTYPGNDPLEEIYYVLKAKH